MDEKSKLVVEAHKALDEIAKMREKALGDEMSNERLIAYVSLADATSRLIDATIRAENWAKEAK